MKRRKVKKQEKLSKFEKLLYVVALTLSVISPFSIVFSKATLSQINFEVEQKKREIELQVMIVLL